MDGAGAVASGEQFDSGAAGLAAEMRRLLVRDPALRDLRTNRALGRRGARSRRYEKVHTYTVNCSYTGLELGLRFRVRYNKKSGISEYRTVQNML